MSSQTTNLHLTKPDATDAINIADINGNMDTIDGAYAAIVAAIAACMTLGVGTAIPSTVNALSQLTNAGVYSLLSGASTQFSDLPSTWAGAALKILVFPTAVEWRKMQILFPVAPVSSQPVPHVWMRYQTGGSAQNPSGATYQPWVDFSGTIL